MRRFFISAISTTLTIKKSAFVSLFSQKTPLFQTLQLCLPHYKRRQRLFAAVLVRFSLTSYAWMPANAACSCSVMPLSAIQSFWRRTEA